MFKDDPENAKNILGKTAFYDPDKFEVTAFITGRHIKDIMRSVSHELVHHTQNCKGLLNNDEHAEEGYAQKDKHLREMEKEAYLKGNMIFRDFEDSIKTKDKVLYEHLQKRKQLRIILG